MDYIVIGEKVHKNRLNRNMSQEELAEEIGISTSYLGQIERGQKKAALKTLDKISDKLQIPIENLICEIDTSDELYIVLHEGTKDLNESDKINILKTVKMIIDMLNSVYRRHSDG